MTERKFLPWFGLALALALILRLLRLGEAPLTDAEASWALQALGLLRAQPVTIGANPLYVHLTAVFFFILQPSNFAARLFPALMGSFLSLLPLFFSDRLGHKAALLLAFFLALDPGLLALARTAASAVSTLTLLLLTWGLWRKQRPELAGISAGLALLSGAALWSGLLVLAVAYGLTRALAPETRFTLEKSSLRRATLYALGTYLTIGSFFLLSPGGLGAIFRLPLAELLNDNGFPVLSLPAALLIYQPLALLFALAAVVRGIYHRNGQIIFLTVWFTAALILATALPSRSPADLIWTLPPLWTLAAFTLEPLLRPALAGKVETLSMAALTFLLLVFAGLGFTAIASGRLDVPGMQLYSLVSLAAVLMIAISAALVAQGWSVSVAWQGTLWGGLAFFATLALSTALFAAQLKPQPSLELWNSAPRIAQAAALPDQMNELSLRKRGTPQSLDVVVVGVTSPALEWLLRDWPLRLQADFSPTENPAFLITPEGFSSPQLQSAYRGGDFRWRVYPAWGQASNTDRLNWLVNHRLPSGEENLILWARSDLFSNEP